MEWLMMAWRAKEVLWAEEHNKRGYIEEETRAITCKSQRKCVVGRTRKQAEMKSCTNDGVNTCPVFRLGRKNQGWCKLRSATLNESLMWIELFLLWSLTPESGLERVSRSLKLEIHICKLQAPSVAQSLKVWEIFCSLQWKLCYAFQSDPIDETMTDFNQQTSMQSWKK